MAKFDFNTPITEDTTLVGSWNCGEYDPENPTITGVKNALDAGDLAAFPVGTEIPDTWDGNDNPLIVGTYQVIEKGGEKYRVVGLLRKYVDPTSQAFGGTNYGNSTILPYLNGEYLDKCSDALKVALSEIEVDYYDGSSLKKVAGKVHLFSGVEIGGTYNSGEGVFWEYWQQQTGLAAPSNDSNTGRKVYDRSSIATGVWLRSYYSNSYALRLTSGGVISNYGSNYTLGVLPQFWFVSSEPIPAPSIDGLQKAIENGTAAKDYPVGTVIPDTWNGISDPLIVVHHFDSSNSVAYGGVEGVVLQRNHIDSYPMALDEADTGDYKFSTMNNYLGSDYMDKCSDAIKSAVQKIKLPYFATQNQTTPATMVAKWFLPSSKELHVWEGEVEWGVAFDFYKDSTLGFSASSPNRVNYTLDGAVGGWWTRDYISGSPSGQVAIYTSGQALYSGVTPSSVYTNPPVGASPCCFIGKGYDDTSVFTRLKQAMQDGTAKTKYPIGTEIPDTYDGQSNPLIIAQYLDSTNNSAYNGSEGVILIRKYATDTTTVAFGGYSGYADWDLDKYLSGASYQSKCSEELLSALSDIYLPAYVVSWTLSYIQRKIFAMSATEVMGQSMQMVDEGIAWDYWKQKTGLTAPSNASNTGRNIQNSFSYTRVGLRTLSTYGQAYAIEFGGAIEPYNSGIGQSLLPAFFISKN